MKNRRGSRRVYGKKSLKKVGITLVPIVRRQKGVGQRKFEVDPGRGSLF